MQLIEKAPAKVNLSLGVVGKQADGYHLLEMINHSIPLEDELILTPSDRFHFTSNVKELNGSDNLVVRVVQLMSQFLKRNPDFNIELIKNIPQQAGLGGGSADAAAMLRLIARYWGLEIPPDQLRYLALKIGADVPYCLENQTAYVEGIGEKIFPLNEFSPGGMLLLNPDIPVSTPKAFQLLDRENQLFLPDSMKAVRCLEEGNYHELKNYAGNSFIKPLSSLYPQLKEYQDRLYNNGAYYATMSGSGPTMAAYFDSKEERDKAAEAFEDVPHICID